MVRIRVIQNIVRTFFNKLQGSSPNLGQNGFPIHLGMGSQKNSREWGQIFFKGLGGKDLENIPPKVLKDSKLLRIEVAIWDFEAVDP